MMYLDQPNVTLRSVSIRLRALRSVISSDERTRKLRRVQKIFAVIVGVVIHSVSYAQTNEYVGEVSLVLGKAYRLSRAGVHEILEQGSQIAVGDQISTLSNGHVHVRFVDDALVSVRPNSLLFVTRYDYNAEKPVDSAIKFELQEGVTRAISGDAAKAARNRFRLNTPIAAIGVRGTDFVVSASAGTTRALVNEGAIVMAPYSGVCSADALGPCLDNALELRADDVQVVSIEQNDPLPRLLPPQTMRAPDILQQEVQLAVANRDKNGEGISASTAAAASSQDNVEQEVSNEVLLESVTTVQLRADAEVAAESVASKDFVPVDPVVVVAAAEGPVALFDLTPPSPLTSPALRDRQLVWGRYADTALATDRLALPFEEAIASRRITVGNLSYGLFRAEPGPRRLATDVGIVGFQLTSAQAVFNSATGVAAMTVNGGALDIDFLEGTFETALDLTSDFTGQVLFSANGIVADGGFLRALEATQRVAGAVSLDGTEAGYLFEKQIDGGSVSGLTLWDGQ